MSDDDHIAALTQAVKQEVIERYLRERMITEGEICLLLEDACSLHGGMSAWEKALDELAGALITPQAAEDFFALAGLPAPEGGASGDYHFPRPFGLTRAASYLHLIEGLYRQVYEEAQRLAEERKRVRELTEEVNRDIKRFEANNDLMSLASYLRSLDPKELQRRKLMGVNFSANEKAAAAAALSFKPVDVSRLALPSPPRLRPPSQVMSKTRPLLRQVVKKHRRQVDALWA